SRPSASISSMAPFHSKMIGAAAPARPGSRIEIHGGIDQSLEPALRMLRRTGVQGCQPMAIAVRSEEKWEQRNVGTARQPLRPLGQHQRTGSEPAGEDPLGTRPRQLTVG